MERHLTPHRPSVQAEFSRSEYERRLGLIQRALVEDELPALLLADPVNIRYVTGYYTEWWKNPSRRRACWVPASGEPILVTVGGESHAAAETSYWGVYDAGGPSETTTRINGVPVVNFERDLIDGIVTIARELELGGAPRVGLPMGACSRIDVPLEVVTSVQSELGISEWADVTPLLYTARQRKSAEELTCVRRSVEILDAAFASMQAELTLGLTEVEMVRVMRTKVLLAGSEESGFLEAVADIQALYGQPSSRPFASRALTPGSVAFLDGGAISRGYWSDYNRLFISGAPTGAQRAAYDVLRRTHYHAIESIRPGITASDLTRQMIGQLEAGGYTQYPVRRMGHAIGLEMPEPPFLHVDDSTVLDEGMVMCIEPNAYVPGVGAMVLEDQVVVGSDGAEQLSTFPTPEALINL